MLGCAWYFVCMILGRGCVVWVRCVPMCRSITGLFGVITYGVCLVFVGASICVVLLGVVAPAMSCGRFLLWTLLGEGFVF